jgi:hypothetical protein
MANTGGSGTKIKEPETFHGEQSKLRGFLAQLQIYFENTPTRYDTHEKRISYTKSLLRDSANKWIIPFVEGKARETWNTWDEFKRELQQQFGDPDAKEAARNRLENMTQGTRSVSQFWTQFRLVATDAEFGDETLGRIFLKGLTSKLQDQWGARETDFTDTAEMARWAIKMENKNRTIQQLRGSRSTPKDTHYSTPRNEDGTFRTSTRPEPKEGGGDPMDLDATNRRRFTKLSQNEYQRRREKNLCLKCGKPGHRIKDCFVRTDRIRNITIEEENEKEEDLKDEGPQ